MNNSTVRRDTSKLHFLWVCISKPVPYIRIIVILAGWGLLNLPAWAQPDPSAAQRLYSSLVAYFNTEMPIRYDVEISALDKSISRPTNRVEVYVGGFDDKTRSTKTLVKFIKPLSFKGRLFLYESGRLWVYFPNTNQPLRIPPQEQLFGDADVGSILDIDFRRYFKLVDSSVESATSQEERIVLEPIAQEAPYGRLVFYFKQGKPYKGEYYGSSGKLLKWAKFDHYAQSGNKHYVQQVRVYAGSDTAAANGTLIQYMKADFIRLPDNNFNPAYLKNIR